MFPETRNAPSQAALESPTCVRAGRFRSERLRGGRLLRPRGGVRAWSWDGSPPLLTGPGSPRPDASCCRADAAGPGNRGGGRERSRSHCRWGSPKFLALKCYHTNEKAASVNEALRRCDCWEGRGRLQPGDAQGAREAPHPAFRKHECSLRAPLPTDRTPTMCRHQAGC